MDELEGSELGTHEYWENRYEKELNNYSNFGDPGEIWFGDDIVDRIIQWMKKTEKINTASKFVDIGCGNGMLLIELANEGYHNLHGLDYSDKAIELAKAIAKKQDINIHYSTCDILEGLKDNYAVIHDKGTYDAISLSENASEKRKKYIENTYKGLDDDGLLIITSCNWTQSELQQQFKQCFDQIVVIPTPQFKFGGSVGNVVSICVFEKSKT